MVDDALIQTGQGHWKNETDKFVKIDENIAVRTAITTDDGLVGVQNPLSTDGDSIYVKDIWTEFSTSANFSGSVIDLFNDLHTQIKNTTSDDPKTIFIHFNRTIVSNAIGLGSAISGDFSNVKISIVNSGSVETVVVDESLSGTKHTSRTFQLPVTAGFNALKIEFYTADTVTLSNCVILKTRAVVSRLQGTKPDNTVTDFNATAGGNFKMSLEEFDSSFLSNPLPVTMTSTSLALQMDEAGSGITYIGEAAIASSTGSIAWRIKRLDESGDPELIIKWADGNADFDNIWDNRASLTYL